MENLKQADQNTKSHANAGGHSHNGKGRHFFRSLLSIGTDNTIQTPGTRSIRMANASAMAGAFTHLLAAIVLLDLDGFKHIDDTHGHEAGDQILQDMASLKRQNLRQTDYCGRWGGEEFLVVLPETTVFAVSQAAEKLRLTFQQHAHPAYGIVTASFGVAQANEGESIDALYRRADIAMYQAKADGRNRVVVAPAEKLRQPGAPSSPGELMMLLLTALALFHGAPLVWYLGLGWLRKRSQVLVGKRRLIWRRRRLGLGSEELSYADRLDVRVEQLLSVTRSTTGALRIQGDIRRLYRDTGTGSLERIRKTSRFTLPAYYEDMDDIAQALARLLTAPGSSACRNQNKHGNT